MTSPLKPAQSPSVGPVRTDKDLVAAIDELQRKLRDLTDLVNNLIVRLRTGQGV